MALAVARPRRSADSSTTSSCSSVAVWMNSTVAARLKRWAPRSPGAAEQQQQAGAHALAAAPMM
jgi:hypothetical protein